ncbi:MAG: hypothetical protein L0I93_00970 [Atopostipes suicloacalis]|nr:hypothetical protein [Atopostipes suicloacalis]
MNIKDEIILFVGQILFLILFSFILKDILAALVVSFFSRPLIRTAVKWIKENSKRKD